jgi:hypothetical protein
VVFPGLNTTGSSRRTKTTPSKWPTHSGTVSDQTPIPPESHEPSLKATQRPTPSVEEEQQIKKVATAAVAATAASPPVKQRQPEKNVEGTAEGPSVPHSVGTATKAVAHQLESTSQRKDSEAAIAKKCGKIPRGNGRVSGSFASRRKSVVKKAQTVLGEEEEDFDDIFADGPRRDSLAGLEILTIGLRRNRTSVGAALKQVGSDRDRLFLANF